MNSRLNTRLRMAVAAVAAVAALVTISALFATQSNDTHSDQLVADLQKQLDHVTDPSTRASLEEKLRIARQSQFDEREAKRQPVDSQKLKEKQNRLQKEVAALPKYPTNAQPRVPAGDGFIVEGAQPPMPAAIFLGETSWFLETTTGSFEVAWAGSVGSDREQGEVVVTFTDKTSGSSSFYPTPTKHGPVRVTGATGRVLDVAAADGTKFRFDMAAKAYQ